MFIVAVYDIANEKRLRRVATTMKDYGVRVQRSVFECIVEKEQLSRLTEEMRHLIDSEQDKVRIYSLCNACQRQVQIFGTGDITIDPDIYIY